MQWLYRALYADVEHTNGTRIPNFATSYFATDSTIFEPGKQTDILVVYQGGK